MSAKVYKCAGCGEAAEKSGTGLGTWRCAGKCPYYRRVRVNRRVGCGKENDSRTLESVAVNRHIKVSRQTAC
jgi:hypothetical protein